MTQQRPFSQVDVFSKTPTLGNPVAVVHDADGLSDAQMQSFARWTNLSETTFLMKPTQKGADYRLRIFMPDGNELPFAGHPTLGSAYAWLAHGRQPSSPEYITQECGIGLVKLRRTDTQLGFEAPELLRSGAIDDASLQKVLNALGVDRSRVVASNWVDNGPGFMGILLDSAESVLAVRPDLPALENAFVGLVGPHAKSGPADYEVRAIVPTVSNGEDAATGSLNGGLAKWLTGSKLAPPSYTVRQGTILKREADIGIVTEADQSIWITGHCSLVIQGTVTL